MTGGTLLISRMKKCFPEIKARLEQLGFSGVEVTGEEKDSLNFVINERKPGLILIGSGFYKCSTPYMLGQLLKRFPKMNVAAVNVGDVPSDVGAWCIWQGARSYVNLWEGYKEFHHGLQEIRAGRQYISPEVTERIEARREMPEVSGITPRQVEILRLLCNGFTSIEAANVLEISFKTLETHKTALYTRLQVRNERELMRAALYLGIIKMNELNFYGGNYQLNPLSEKRSTKKPALRRKK